MNERNVKFFVDGKEVNMVEAEIKYDTIQNEKKYNFNKTYEGTFENVQFSDEFEKYLDKQRKLLKMQKTREELYKYIG